MTSSGYGAQPGSIFGVLKWFFSLLALLLVWMGISMIVNGSHAVEKHGSDALTVRRNCENGNITKQYYNPQTGKMAQCVELKNPVDEKGRCWGLRILKGDCEVTAFVKDNAPFFYQLAQYLERMGYKPKK